MGILSVQSQVVSGFVGNSAATFALQRLGRETWALPTVLLSNHPGHGGFQGGPLPADLKAGILQGLARLGCFSRCEAIISGYLSGLPDAALIIDALQQARSKAPCVYLCDPVLGDDGRAYVSADVAAAIEQLVERADIVTPNAYELARLSQTPFNDRAGAMRAMRILQDRGPKIVFLTSFAGIDSLAANIDSLILDGPEFWQLRQPRLNKKFSGAGDVLAALFLNFWLNSRDSAGSMAQACSALCGILQLTMELGSSELALLQAQDHLVSSRRLFSVERLA